eukprot:350420-Chlamydomonas_euryale.AAC.2
MPHGTAIAPHLGWLVQRAGHRHAAGGARTSGGVQLLKARPKQHIRPLRNKRAKVAVPRCLVTAHRGNHFIFVGVIAHRAPAATTQNCQVGVTYGNVALRHISTHFEQSAKGEQRERLLDILLCLCGACVLACGTHTQVWCTRCYVCAMHAR